MAQLRPQGPTAAPPTDSAIPGKLNAQVDLLVSLHLWTWPALTLAIQNGWGGSSQVLADKRDWFAGAISELLTSSPPQIADVADLEEVLLQVMLDEFEIVVDDGSAEETARKIWASAEKVQAGEIKELESLYTRWLEKQAKGGNKLTAIVRGEDKDGEETDWGGNEDDEDEWEGLSDADGMDLSMGEAPASLEASKQRRKVEPEVDEDGFTKVVKKKQR